MNRNVSPDGRARSELSGHKDQPGVPLPGRSYISEERGTHGQTSEACGVRGATQGCRADPSHKEAPEKTPEGTCFKKVPWGMSLVVQLLLHASTAWSTGLITGCGPKISPGVAPKKEVWLVH